MVINYTHSISSYSAPHFPVRHTPTYLILVHQTRVSTKIQVSTQITERAYDVLQNEAHARVAILALCRELPHTDLSECLLPKSFHLRKADGIFAKKDIITSFQKSITF